MVIPLKNGNQKYPIFTGGKETLRGKGFGCRGGGWAVLVNGKREEGS